MGIKTVCGMYQAMQGVSYKTIVSEQYWYIFINYFNGIIRETQDIAVLIPQFFMP